jgi:NADH-quinone oxidoreductase subunit A
MKFLVPALRLTSLRSKPIFPSSALLAGAAQYNIAAAPRANTMSESYLEGYAPILLHLLVAAGLAAALIAVSWLLGERKPNLTKLSPYECGILPVGDAREPFAVKFYLVAMLFILFDVEVMFLIAWAVSFRDLGLYGFVIMMIFLFVLAAGFVYEWKKGALDWSP